METDKPKAVIVDLDGTLALFSPETRHWSEYTRMMADTFCPVVRDVIVALKQTGYRPVILTGRPNRYRSLTVDWLRLHAMPVMPLIMRADNDRRSNAAFKQEKLLELQHLYDVRLALEDNPAAVDMFRAAGIVCFHVRDFGHNDGPTNEVDRAITGGTVTALTVHDDARPEGLTPEHYAMLAQRQKDRA